MLRTMLAAVLASVTTAQNAGQRNITVQQDPGMISDPLTFGPVPELVHLYYDLWPTGIAVSKSGRMFSNYPRALDPNNLAYTLAELFPNNTERAYPSLDYNNPPQGLVDNSTYPAVAIGSVDHLTGVQSVVIDGSDRMWVLDTGRLATSNGTILNASPGGAKLIGIDLETNQPFTTIVFDPMAAPADSYLNDVRVDLNPELSESGQGVAYITDSSPEGRNAIVIVDLGTGEAWRRLALVNAVQANAGFVPTIWGEPLYLNETNGNPVNNINFGADGIALSADGETLFFATTGGRELWSCPTSLLRDRSPGGEIRARAGVKFHGETGFKDGMDTDSNNIVYAGNLEDNSISMFDPATGFLSTLVRDPRFAWTDAVYVGFDGFIYFTQNQLWRRPAHWGGVERRQPPYSVFRVPLPNGGIKVEQEAPAARK